jgi:hypothetical protein
MVLTAVMAGHSRSKNGVVPLAYVPAIDFLIAYLALRRDAWRRGKSVRRLHMLGTNPEPQDARRNTP